MINFLDTAATVRRNERGAYEKPLINGKIGLRYYSTNTVQL